MVHIRLEDIEYYAKSNNIPIMLKDGINFLTEYIKNNNIKKILEIGSAIGYSAMMMASNIDDFDVETIELDKERYLEARKNIDENALSDQIHIYLADALTFDCQQLLHQQFDCLFIDAAKAQYQKFFEKYMPLVKDNGICIVDNLDFHGMIFDIDHIKNRNTKQLVKKIK